MKVNQRYTDDTHLYVQILRLEYNSGCHWDLQNCSIKKYIHIYIHIYMYTDCMTLTQAIQRLRNELDWPVVADKRQVILIDR